MKEKKRYSTPKLKPETIESIESQVAELAEFLVSANYFVVDIKLELENGRWYLRLYLDHPNEAVKVTLDDCKDISLALGPVIDESVKELKDFPYALEVSSPGLFRKLALPREFQFYAGRRIEIKPKNDPAFIAYLVGYDRETDEVLYKITQAEDAEIVRLSWDAKAFQACLSPDLTQPIETKVVPRRIRRDD